MINVRRGDIITTETQQNQQIDAAEVWRAIGRLEGRMDGIETAVERLSDRVDHLSARVDRLFYLILGIGVATIASIWASNLFGG